MSTNHDDVGEFSIEAKTGTREWTGDTQRHTDARSMGREFGIPTWDPDGYDYRNVLPNMLTHVWDGPPKADSRDKGGTDVLATGSPGSGKSTLALSLAQRLMEINDEKIVWRGTPARSEWLPFAPWATLALPAGVEISARLEPKDPTASPIDVELDELVREVVRYSNVEQINREILQPGTFTVVYPDPLMRGVQSVYDSSDRTVSGVEFSEEDPLKHWWFGWVLSRVERGPFDWCSVFLDEIGDIAPEAARSDDFSTFEKIELLRDCWVDARKTGLSIFLFGHSERDIHNLIRHKIRWRIKMPGNANPTRDSEVVGFNAVPMNHDLSSRLNPGRALAWNERNFEIFKWKDVPKPIDYSLNVSLGGIR